MWLVLFDKTQGIQTEANSDTTMRSRPRVSGNPRWRRKAWTVWLRIATRGLSYNQRDWKTTLIVCVLLRRMQQFLWHGADNSVNFSPVVKKNVALISNCVSERSNSQLKITHVSVWIFAFYVLVRVGKWTHEAITKYWLIHESLVFNWVFLLSNSRDCLVLSSDDFCLHHRRDLHIHILSWQNKVEQNHFIWRNWLTPLIFVYTNLRASATYNFSEGFNYK